MTDLSGETAAPDANPAAAGEYRVLARKYRPQTFEDLVGQEALVRTLRNAFAQNRVHHAFMLTGVRGVGKTTTARIVAKGLNCIGADGQGGPTMQPCGVCQNCLSITDGRHVDVLEMDAASNTGVDDVREIIEQVRYRPSAARYKVFIIDEVHMLSKNAFNALLKTLEEPPEHVKFIFATTEIRKVPVTVLSRCQRFDLKRIDAGVLLSLFKRVAETEAIPAEEEALLMVARAADGSARDGLSILDQAMALSDGTVTAEQVRDMLGVVDRARVYDLFEEVMKGSVSEALELLRTLYDGGADPVVIVQDLMELTHGVTRMKAAPQAAMTNDLSETERDRGRALSEVLSVPVLTRTWQMLSRGLSEVQSAPVAIAAAEMILIRLAYAADLPDPGALVRQLTDMDRTGAKAEQAATAPAPTGPDMSQGMSHAASNPDPAPRMSEPGPEFGPEPAEPTRHVGSARTETPATEPASSTQNPATFADIIELVHQQDPFCASQLKRDAHFVGLGDGVLQLRLADGVKRDLLAKVQAHLIKETGTAWVVEASDEAGAPTIREQEQADKQARDAEIAQDPVVTKVLEVFPGAVIESVAQPDMPDGSVGLEDGEPDTDLSDPDGIDQAHEA